MNEHQAMEYLNQISKHYQSIKTPKYRNADLDTMKGHLETLYGLKEYMKDNKTYKDLINGISQVIQGIEKNKLPEGIWSNVSDRGINKAIWPLPKRPEHSVSFPFEWTDQNGNACFMNGGYWDARNFMVMDAIGYMSLLNEGGDSMPKEPSLVFKDMSSIGTMTPLSNYEIKFNDAYFRKFTAARYSSIQIWDLLQSTAMIEFKLVFPVYMKEEYECFQQTI